MADLASCLRSFRLSRVRVKAWRAPSPHFFTVEPTRLRVSFPCAGARSSAIPAPSKAPNMNGVMLAELFPLSLKSGYSCMSIPPYRLRGPVQVVERGTLRRFLKREPGRTRRTPFLTLAAEIPEAAIPGFRGTDVISGNMQPGARRTTATRQVLLAISRPMAYREPAPLLFLFSKKGGLKCPGKGSTI